jgi:DNA-3-methyladenine glycosylase
LGLDRTRNGVDLTSPDSPVRLYAGEPAGQVFSGPRVGVAVAMDVPWRFWVDSPAVSTYKRGGKRRRSA